MNWRIVLGFAALAQSAPAAPGTEELAAEVRPLGWILYSARTAVGDWDLFASRPDGSAPRNLTNTPETSEFYPRLTADGKRLLFRRLPKGESISGNRHGEQGEPILAAADAYAAKSLGPPGSLPWASWSPDGTQLLTLAPKGFSIIEVATGKVVRSFPRNGFYQQTSWSPDGKSVLGVSNGFGTGWSIAVLDIATGKATAVNREDCCTPDWSADGAKVIFSWRPPVNGNPGAWTQLWLGDPAGGAPRLLYAEDGRHTYGGCLSPDGQFALFTGNAQEDGDPNNAGAPMQVMRVADAGKAGKSAPLLTLTAGWEPLWTGHEIIPAGN
jgi:Tol biopolymer transport system component